MNKTTAELYHEELSVKNKYKEDYIELKTNLNIIFPNIEYLFKDENFLQKIQNKEKKNK